MRIKTFYAKTMAEALREIRDVLGPDALLLSTKEIPSRAGAWGRSSGFEVVAACDHAEDIDVVSPSFRTLSEGQRKSAHSQDAEAAELADGVAATYTPGLLLKNQAVASAGKTARSRKSAAAPVAESPAEMVPEKEVPFKGRIAQGVYQELMHCGVDAALAQDLVRNAWDLLPAGQRRSRPALMRSVTQAIASLVPGPSTRNELPEKKIMAFVGPTGVGKTTSIAKLAAHLALEKKKKVLLLTLDGYRIGAVEQLRSYAGLMGIPFRFVDHVSELPRVLEDNRQRDFILIDTAGRGPRDMAAMQSLAAYLKESEQIERHLVLSATTKQSDMRRIVDQFEVCRPDHLLFTKLDETSTPGPILNELVRTQKHFSYYTDGQSVPDDLHAVLKERIIDIVLNRTENALKE